MANILAVGIAALDIINTVKDFPQEDEEVRALSQRICRGGNAANTLAVLRQLGHDCSFAGVLSDDMGGLQIQQDMEQRGIDLSPALKWSGGTAPTSYITLNQRNGSRTIVHYRDLPELPYSWFESLDLSGYDWLHFEGRNVAETLKMMQQARKQHPELKLSLEIEKEREDIDTLLPLGDVLLFSRPFALGRGFGSPEECLEHFSKLAQADILICTWGDSGAAGLSRGRFEYSQAFPPPRVIDTIGAGDTFNAGIVDALNRNLPLNDTLQNACRIAGRKCGQLGFEHLFQDR